MFTNCLIGFNRYKLQNNKVTLRNYRKTYLNLKHINKTTSYLIFFVYVYLPELSFSAEVLISLSSLLSGVSEGLLPNSFEILSEESEQ